MAACRFFSRARQFKPKKRIDIQYVRKHKFREAVNFMRKNYADEPLMCSMGITEKSRETHQFLSALWLILLRSELSLAAVHQGKICGLSINFPHSQGENLPKDIILKMTTLVKTDSTRNLLLSWDKIDREVSMHLKKSPDGRLKKIMEVAGLAVDPSYRRKGIAKKLIESSANLAKMSGFEYIRVDCTNPVTAKICHQLGWQKVWEMPFLQFKGVSADVYAFYNGKTNDKVMVYLQPVRSDLH